MRNHRDTTRSKRKAGLYAHMRMRSKETQVKQIKAPVY